MRRVVLFLAAAVVAATTAFAQVPGGWAVDAFVAPTAGFGFGYNFSQGLSLRPWFGLGYSDFNGFFMNVGAELRYELLSDSRLSPYVSASGQYLHNNAMPVSAVDGYPSSVIQSDLGLFGGGAGLRYRAAERLAVFAEGRLLRSTSPNLFGPTGWSTIHVDDRTRADVVLGVTYLLH
jgi:hypothetical protein